jgi:hypothetical protein
LFTVVWVLVVGGLAFGDNYSIDGLKLHKPEDGVHVRPVPPPKGALVLFHGQDLKAWTKMDGKSAAAWKLVEGGAMEVRGGNIITRKEFDGHFRLHVEFRVPYMPKATSQGRGNSGVYLQGRYEVQVLDSYDNPTYAKGGCGAIYGIADPRVNVLKAPAVWQSYDIDFHAPVFENGKKVEMARMTVCQNGVQIHDDVKIPLDNTVGGRGGDPSKPGPIMLQDHGNPVQYRNIWVLPLQEKKEEGWTTLFNGKDFEGWKFHLGQEGADNQGTFTIKEGILICTGKPAGYMYTQKSYRNYTLRVEFAFKRPKGLATDSAFRGNSGCLIHIGDKNALGVWPRSIEVQGYYQQIGLILPIPRSLKGKLSFDRKALAKVLKPVGQFNALEIDVRGGQMDISVNGTPVSTVRDCELTQGHIGFQSEGAETHWRNIRVRQLK